MHVECDDVELLVAAGKLRTLSGRDAHEVDHHLATCAACRAIADDDRETDRFRWVVRVPEDALDDDDLLVLPTVDPIVFEHGRELARGGMGRITRVRDRRLGRDIAIKEVLDPQMRSRFEREVAITAQLQHPAIVPVYEAGIWPDGSAFYTMRLVSGGTLAEALAKAKTLAERLALLPHLIALTDALAYAHSKGIVHRDLKPGNVLVGEFGETVVIDWGLAKELHRDIDPVTPASRPSSKQLTQHGAVLGTPGFMAPEQAAGRDVDERADVYALGAILYTVLAGTHPFADVASDTAIALAATKSPTPITMLAPDAPADLRAIVERAMARDPNARFRTAREIAEELHRFDAGKLLSSRAYGLGELLGRWLRRHRAAVAVSAIALAIVIAVGVIALVNVTRSRSDAIAARTTAESSVTQLLEEQGHAQLAAGERERALVYLAEAYARGASSPAIRHAITAALRDFDPLESATELPGAEITVYLVALAFTGDGELVSLTTDGRVHARTPWSLGAEVATARFAPTGTRLLSVAKATADPRTVQLHDVATGALIANLAVDAAPNLDGAAFSADGSRVALCTASGTLHVWDAVAGAAIAQHAGCTGHVAFAANDRVAFDRDLTTIVLWTIGGAEDAFGGVEIAGAVAGLAARGDLVASSDSGGNVTLWSHGRILGKANANTDHLAFSPDGALLVGAGMDARAHVWSADTLQLVADLPSPPAKGWLGFQPPAWSRDGQHVAVGRDMERTVETFRRPAGGRLARVPSSESAIARDAAIILGSDELTALRLDTGAVIARRPRTDLYPASQTEQSNWMTASRAAHRAVFNTDKDCVIWDIDSSRWLRLPFAARSDCEISDDGRFVVIVTDVGETGSAIRIHDAGDGRLLRETAERRINAVSIAPGGDRMIVTWIHPAPPLVVELATDAATTTGAAPDSGRAVFTRDGTRALVYAPKTATIIDVASGRALVTLAGATNISRAAFDASGAHLVTSYAKSAHLWDARTGAHLLAIPAINDDAIAISPEGARVAVADERGTIQIWEASGRLLDTLPSIDTAQRLAWSADGTRLLVTGWMTEIYDVHLEQRPPALIAELAARSPWKLAGGSLVAR